MALKLKEYRSGFDRGPALADFLPYDSFDDGVFHSEGWQPGHDVVAGHYHGGRFV